MTVKPDPFLGKALPRGSRSGIIAKQQASVERTKMALEYALVQLRGERPTISISKKAVCERAGLKSTVALHSKVNENVLRGLEEHNRQVYNSQKNRPVDLLSSEAKDELILRQDAEISYLLRKNRRLERQLADARRRS